MSRPPAFARGPVFTAVFAAGVALSLSSGGYGYERDELYFALLRPSWGYLDQPPLIPLLAHGISAVVDQPWALRIPATVATMVTIVVLALVTRELGGQRFAQGLCAWGVAFAALPLALGHALLTATLDAPVWPAILLFVVRAQRRAQPRWWLAAGLVVGLSLYNKLLVADLLIAVAIGLVLVGPRRLLLDRRVLGGLAIGLIVGAPNLVYQALNGWPQFTVGRALEQHNGADVRVQMWPLLALMLGPPLVPIWAAGLVAFWRDRTLRFVAAAFPVMLLIVFLMGSQPYYELGLLCVLFAAGCPPTARWLHQARWRRDVVVAFVTVNGVVGAVFALPMIPASVVGQTPVPSVNQIVADSIGWPTYVGQIARIYRQVPLENRAHTIVYASNYGEAGAIARYGRAAGLPAVYSGQNGLWHQARPPRDATTIVFVGGAYYDSQHLFAGCGIRAYLDNRVHVDNEEQGEPVAICRGPTRGWAVAWPRLKHVD